MYVSIISSWGLSGGKLQGVRNKEMVIKEPLGKNELNFQQDELWGVRVGVSL